MNAKTEQLVEVLIEAGVAPERIDAWDGTALAIIRQDSKPTPGAASEPLGRNEAATDWSYTVRLGDREVGISLVAGERLQRQLRALDIAFERG